jgi:RNA polymerase sigma-70 factor (ECF subfamily)
MVVLSLRTNEEITEIYNRYVDVMYRIALMMLKNREDAEDAVSAVFIKLMATETNFENDEHMKAWLIVTTKNSCKDMLKGRWYSKRVDYDSIEEPFYIPDLFANEIWEKITNLGEKYKLLVYLFYYEGYKSEEIAEMLNVKHATVRTRLRAAKKKLRLLIEY